MSTSKTYGSKFLDALDSSLNCRLLTYAERQAMRQMDRDEVVEKLKLNRLAVFRGVAELSAEETASRFANEWQRAQGASSLAMGLMGTGLGEVVAAFSNSL